jgi:hypothetical protein
MFICLEDNQYGVNVNRSRLTPLEINRDFLYTGPDKVKQFCHQLLKFHKN